MGCRSGGKRLQRLRCGHQPRRSACTG
jgi:hypothetical protein